MDNIVEVLDEIKRSMDKIADKYVYKPIPVKVNSYLRTKAFQKISDARTIIEKTFNIMDDDLIDDQLIDLLMDTLYEVDNILTFKKEDIKNE